MFGLGRCKACEAKDAEILHLRTQQIKLEDRLMAMSDKLAPYEATRPDKDHSSIEQIHVDEASGKIYRYEEKLASWEEITDLEQLEKYKAELEHRKKVNEVSNVDDEWMKARGNFITEQVDSFLQEAHEQQEKQEA